MSPPRSCGGRRSAKTIRGGAEATADAVAGFLDGTALASISRLIAVMTRDIAKTDQVRSKTPPQPDTPGKAIELHSQTRTTPGGVITVAIATIISHGLDWAGGQRMTNNVATQPKKLPPSVAMSQ